MGTSTNSKQDDTAQEQSQSVSYLQLIRGNVDFRYLWSGQIVSLFGDWFNLIGSAALIAQLTQSGLAVGGLFVIRMLAQFVGTQVGGVAADRYNRKRLLILTDITRAIVAFGFLLVRGPEQVWFLYALTALLMAISGVFFPTRTAILADIVTKRELGSANALSSTTWIYQAFAVDGLSFLVSAALIAGVRYQHEDTGRKAELRAVLDEYMDGLRYLKRETDILFITLHKAALGLMIAGGAIYIVMVQISEGIFVIGEGGATSRGILFAVVGLHWRSRAGAATNPAAVLFTRYARTRCRGADHEFRDGAAGYVPAHLRSGRYMGIHHSIALPARARELPGTCIRCGNCSLYTRQCNQRSGWRVAVGHDIDWPKRADVADGSGRPCSGRALVGMAKNHFTSIESCLGRGRMTPARERTSPPPYSRPRRG
jgi:MFS family permease